MADRNRTSEISSPMKGCTARVEDGKRFTLPGVEIKSICPKCKKKCKFDLGEHYLAYPVMNTPFVHTLYCGDCDVEWQIRLRLVVQLTFA